MRNKLKQAILFAFIALAFNVCLSGFVSAQEITGSLNGTVRDTSGAVVPGATVTITDPAKGNIVIRTLTTGDDGEFIAPNLPVSVYSISIESANFKKSVQTDIKLDVGQRRAVDFVLEAGNISETVTVEADEVAVNLSTPTAGTTISGEQVRELSVNNRNFVQLITLAPGVSNNLSDQVFVGTTNPEGQANTVSIAVNGARSSQNTYTIDGADVTDRGSNLTIQAYPSLDSIGEFKVLRSLYPAESGRSGGGQVNIVTRSGTDQFHGSLFEFVRNEKFNANSFFNNQTPTRDSNGHAIRPPFRYNNYGFTVGGPVYFLKFGERDPGDKAFGKVPKTYFFFSEEQRRDIRYPTLTNSSGTLPTVPDANLRNGIFPIDICLSATRTAAGVGTCTNVLTAGTPFASRAVINPVSQAYLNIYRQLPLPNASNFTLIGGARNTSNFRQEIIKFDTALTNKLSAFYRFQRDSIPTFEANSLFSNGTGLPGVSTTVTDSPGRTHTFQATYVASPNLIIEGRYSYAYGAILSNNVGLLATSNTIVPVSLAYPNQRDRIPTIGGATTPLTGTGFSSFTGFGPYNNFSDKNDFAGGITYIVGNHTTKFGAIFSKYRKNENALAGNNEGIFSNFLNTTPDSPSQGLVCTNGTCAAGTQTTLQTFANFLLGTNASFAQAKADYTADLRQRNFEAYGQDEYRIRKNLTLYYGVRYSFFGSPWDRNGLLTNFVPELYNAAQAPLVTGAGNRLVDATKNFCNGLIVNSQNYQTAPNNCNPIVSPYGKYVVKAPKNNFAPRIGLAWDPFGNGRTSIRTGYGIFHEQTLVGIFEQNLISNPPYQETTSLTQIALNQSFATNPLATLGTISVRGEDTDWKTPYMQHWSLDVQHQFTKNTIVDVGYYGSKGTNLIGIVDINLLPPGYAAGLSSTACATGGSTTPTVACQVANTPFTSATAENILDQIRPYRGYKAVNIIKPEFNSNYHSLQVSAQHRFSGASEINLAYTFSKNLTDNQTDRSSAPQNPYDIRAEYGRAQLDRRHIFVTNYVYEIPYFRHSNGLTRLLLGGWQTSGIFNYQTGLPLTVTTSNFDPSGLGLLGASASGARPNQIGDPNSGAPNTQQQFFNISAFQRTFPASGFANSVGSAGRGTVFGPRTVRFDMSLMKNFHFTESMRLQLRAEAFNIFNTTNFTTVNTNASQATFGTVTGARDPRTLQFGAKFYF